ncbi:MAG: phosphoenolpyruvate-protein phosphotransferase system enzyme, partial [Baekduia sp.]|nr:phosphoenolpyruvate-protein phosphotransferase system enzyme [Baekduia sp.]
MCCFTPVCVDLSINSCNLIHMSTSPSTTSHPTQLAAGTVLQGVPAVAGVQYAPVIRPGARPPVEQGTAPALDQSARPAEAARFAAAAGAVAARLRERAAHATGSASEVLAAT